MHVCSDSPAESYNEILGVSTNPGVKAHVVDAEDDEVVDLHWVIRLEGRAVWAVSYMCMSTEERYAHLPASSSYTSTPSAQ